MSRALDITRTCLCGQDLIVDRSPTLGDVELEATPRGKTSGVPLEQCRWINAAGVLALHVVHRHRCPLLTTTKDPR